MPTVLTFVVPIRHPDNARDWSKVRSNLTATLASIAAQNHPAWRAVVVANHGSDLPPMPKGVEIAWVDFPPNAQHDIKTHGRMTALESVRLDKGRRVLAGMLGIRDTRFYMVVDDDDFVSNRLVDFVSKNQTANGWRIYDGYVWTDGGRWLYRHDHFCQNCGTSLIIRADLYHLPQTASDATEDYVKTMMGSHIVISDVLESRNTPLAPLPFSGAIYRIGNPVSHSGKSSIWNFFFFSPKFKRTPLIPLRNLSRLRLLNRKVRKEFFGA